MSAKLRKQLPALLFMILTLVTASIPASAQVSSTSGSTTTSFGSFTYQVDRAPITTTLSAYAGFNSPPGFFAPWTSLNVASPFTVHEVHGTFSLVTFNAFDGTTGSCGNGSVVAQVLDQNGNAIAAVKLQVLGPGTTNVPITGTFVTPLSVSSLVLQYDVDLCGPQTITLSLVMS
jgi:hypothetical protein